MGGRLLVLENWAWDCVVDSISTLHAEIPQDHWNVCHMQVPTDSFFEEANVYLSAIGPRGSCLQNKNFFSKFVEEFLFLFLFWFMWPAITRETGTPISLQKNVMFH